jgi:hypothetical protein
VVLNLPSTQPEHDTVPFSEVYFPWGHWRQADSDEAPAVALYRPAVQLVHDVAAVGVAAYFPAAQLTQTDSEVAPWMTLCFPAGHSRHVCSDEAPSVVLYRPAGQLVHDAVPGTLEYFPAAQRTQTDSEVAPGMAL